MNPDNTLTVNCVEAYPLDAFSPEVRSLPTLPSLLCTFHNVVASSHCTFACRRSRCKARISD